MSNSLAIRIISASNLRDADGPMSGHSDPYTRITLLDQNKKQIGEIKRTQVIKEGGSHPVWNENFAFTGLQTPCAYFLRLNVLDRDYLSRDDDLGDTEIALGELRDSTEWQEFEEDIRGRIWKSKLKFALCTKGTWGNGPSESNKLVVKVNKAHDLPEKDHLVGSDKSDPYVHLRLVDKKGKDVAPAKSTQVLDGAGATPVWNEELAFEQLASPAACTLVLEVYDKDRFTRDDYFGKVEINLGLMRCSTKFEHYPDRKLLGSKTGAVLDFEISNAGTWGNSIRGAVEVNGGVNEVCAQCIIA